MEAYSAPVGYVFSLNAGGRSGVFDVVAGDFSTELAADTLNGIYIGLADDSTAASKVAKRRERAIYPEMFGAIGDGVNDDSIAMNAMFDQTVVGSSGEYQGRPGAIYKLASTVTTGPIDNKSSSFRGNSSTLRLADGVTFNIRNSDVIFEGVIFDQVAGTAKNSDGVLTVLDVSNVTIRDCQFLNLQRGGIKVEASSVGNVRGVTIDNCVFVKNSSTDIKVVGYGASNTVEKVSISNCRHESPTDPMNPGSTQLRAVHLISWCKEILITGNKCFGVALADYTSGWRDGIMVGNSSATGQPDDITITGCSITGMSDDAVGISGATNVKVIGNTLYGSKVTSGVYQPGAGTYTSDNILVSNNLIYDHRLSGIFLKDSLNYKITDNKIYDCVRGGITALDQGTGVKGGVVSGNTLENIGNNSINVAGYSSICANTISGFGDAASSSVTDKDAIRVKGESSVKGNHIENGPISLLYTGAGTNFVVEGNTGKLITDTVHKFIGFSGDRFIIANNVIERTGIIFAGQPTASATIIYKDNM
jgi:parallel beta-helix repeat protein